MLDQDRRPGLPVQALGPYTVSSPPLPPEEEVFSISLEKEKRAPSWQLDFVEKLKGESLAFLRPKSPPLKLASDEDSKLPATPKPMVVFQPDKTFHSELIRCRVSTTRQLQEELEKFRGASMCTSTGARMSWNTLSMFLPGRSLWRLSTCRETGRGEDLNPLNTLSANTFSRVQTDITVNMRAALLKWLVGISRLTELSLETW